MEGGKMTYDLVYQVYQDERQKTLLSKVDKDFYESVAELIRELKEGYDEVSKETPSSAKAMLLLDELKKLRTLIREIFEYRIRKVALLALTAASEGSVDTKNLVGREVLVFDQIFNILKGGYDDILQVEQGVVSIVPASDGEGTKTKVTEKEGGKVKASGRVPVADKAEEGVKTDEVKVAEPVEKKKPVTADTGKGTKGKERNTVAVLILEDIPKFLGQGGEVYSLKKKDFTSLPLAMAKRLVKEGKARIMPS
jgi:DNA replication initiation complex subunit (GINS family)